MAWDELAVAPFLQWFAGAVWGDLRDNDQVRLSFLLTRFALTFDRMPEQGELARWISSLERHRGGGRISAATMFDYYQRFRYVYRCAILAYPPAAQFTPLPYQSFRPLGRPSHRQQNPGA